MDKIEVVDKSITTILVSVRFFADLLSTKTNFLQKHVRPKMLRFIKFPSSTAFLICFKAGNVKTVEIVAIKF